MKDAQGTEAIARLRLSLMRLARRLRQQAEAGVSPSVLSALSTLEKGPLSLGELADAERVQPPTMSRIVARLEEMELIIRVADADDKRVARVSLSPAGKKMLSSNRSRKNAYLARRLRDLGISDGEVARTVDLLESILDEDAQ